MTPREFIDVWKGHKFNELVGGNCTFQPPSRPRM